jgi:signal transduction histidine kinase
MAATRDPQLRTLVWLALALVAAGLITLGAVVTTPAAALITVALWLAAALIWRLTTNLMTSRAESRAWTEVALLRAIAQRSDATFAALPAAAAAWDSEGQFITATALWRQLGLSAEQPPDAPEITAGEPPRVFVVEQTATPDHARVVLLREVTRERQALQAKDELLAIVGHELRTPLTAIKGYSQLMVRQLGTVQEQVMRLDRLIGDVLDSARADSGRLQLRREPLSVRELANAAAERFQASHPDRVIEVEQHAEALIEGDAQRLGQVVDNLLSNAAKYSGADTPIVLRVDSDDELARVEIVDRGAGIAAEHLPHLFDRFYRVNADDAPPGLGLGLSIVRDLVEAHGGRVEVASDGLGHGSRFSVLLPIAIALRSQETADQVV